MELPFSCVAVVLCCLASLVKDRIIYIIVSVAEIPLNSDTLDVRTGVTSCWRIHGSYCTIQAAESLANLWTDNHR